jgi:hypothetical protein
MLCVENVLKKNPICKSESNSCFDIKSKFLIIEMANEMPISEIVIVQIFRKVT